MESRGSSEVPPVRGHNPRDAEVESPGAAQEEVSRLELRQEELVPHKELQELGEVVIRTSVEEVPGRLEIEAYREEIEIQHVPIGQVVADRGEPREEDGVLIIPLYEEQLVVAKRLVLREELHVRRLGLTETRLFEGLLRKENVVVEDPDQTGSVREQFPTGEEFSDPASTERGDVSKSEEKDSEGLVERVVRKVIS